MKVKASRFLGKEEDDLTAAAAERGPDRAVELRGGILPVWRAVRNPIGWTFAAGYSKSRAGDECDAECCGLGSREFW